ncbi:MAG: hypothetical protein JW919_06220 [Candidatus Omnitrophica bacterium]|nr:hypothetical protein [Candidatus Omnitrophota bacterium]
MRYPLKWAVLLVCMCAMVSGCATMRYPRAYKVEGKEIEDFKDLSDDQALKVVALIYSVMPESWEDGIARSLALEEYMKLLAKRNSRYIKDSGIFGAEYDKVKLSSWKDVDLIKLFDYLAPKAKAYYAGSAPELTESQNARRITYLTAINSVVNELKRRDITQKALSIAANVLMTALSVALSMI